MKGDLVVTVILDLVTGTTVSGYGGYGGFGYKSTSAPARIQFRTAWTPSVLLDPAPVFSIITEGETDVEFAILQLAAPDPIAGTVLPTTDEEFVIPEVGAPDFATVLPSVVPAWASGTGDIPQVSISTNVASGLLNLPDTTDASPGFLVPDLVALNLVATAPGTTPDAPEADVAFTIPGGAPPTRGLGTDGSNFWVIEGGAGGGGVDKLVKLTGAGATTGTAIDGPSDDIDGVAFLNGFLWVLENRFRCDDDVVSTCDDTQNRVYKIDPADTFPAESDWAVTGDAVRRSSSSR